MPQPLTTLEIRELLKSKKNRDRLARAARHEARLRLHGTLNLAQGDALAAGVAVTEFLNWWEGVLSKPEKFNLFCVLFRFPLPTVAFTEKIFAALEKVFDGRNPVQQYDFNAPEAAQDWQVYREMKKLPGFFRRKVFDTLVEGRVNSLVVVDLPQEQEGDLPEPYPYLLNIEAVHDYEWDGEAFRWIAFPLGEDRMAWFDQTHYRIFKLKGKGSTEIVGVETEIPHDLGYTPVRWMWTDPVSNATTDLKESPLSKHLGELDWLLAYLISKRVNELTAQYPIYWGYAPKCTFVQEDRDRGIYLQCHVGFLRDGSGQYQVDGRTGALHRCPVCSKSKLLGAGSFVGKPMPKQDEKDLGDPVGVVPAENVSLEYNSQEVDRLRKAIFIDVTGAENEAVNDQAVNEKQVGAIVDAKTQALINLKPNFESLQKWTEETMARLRYGQRVFMGATINLGTEFHILRADDLLTQYEDRRKAGANASVLDRLWEDYLAARYRFDPIMQQREKILLHLDPFRHKTADEVKNLGTAPPELIYLKFNFSTLIARFEREHGDLTTFASQALDFNKRIEIVTEILIQYVEEKIQRAEPPERRGEPASAGVGVN